MDALLIIAIVATIFVIIFVASGFKIIQQAETMVIERLGKYNRTLESGINIIIPVFDKPRSVFWRYIATDVSGVDIVTQRMTKTIDLREQVFDFPRQNVITKDNVTIEIDAMLYFQITDPVKSTINTKLRAILDEATDKWGVKVNRVELQDITPPPEIQKAMEQQMRAERDRRASILEAEGKKKAAILESEGVKESAINMAEGEKKSAILQAEGEAEARIKVATAEKEAIDRITEAISATKGDPANYLIAVRYIETLKEMVSGQNNKVVYLPYEATGVLSSIGGIKDMLTGIGKK